MSFSIFKEEWKMLKIEEPIFKRKRFNLNNLEMYGFVKKEENYEYIQEFMNGSFQAIIQVNFAGKMKGNVIDTANDEEYMPLYNENYNGEYVNLVRDEYTKILKNIADTCCESVLFVSDQANRLTKKILDEYGVTCDFPWKDEKGVFRHPDTKKWFGLIMHVKMNLLCKNNDTTAVDIMNLKVNLDQKEEVYSLSAVYPAYHMNHKMWISVVLDDTLRDDEVMKLIQSSFCLTKK